MAAKELETRSGCKLRISGSFNVFGGYIILASLFGVPLGVLVRALPRPTNFHNRLSKDGPASTGLFSPFSMAGYVRPTTWWNPGLDFVWNWKAERECPS